MLQIERVSKTYHSKGIDYPVLKEISATVHDGEFVAIMGPSGSGKTTLLNVISGFLAIAGIWPLSGFFSKDEILTACFAFSPVMGLSLIHISSRRCAKA